MMASFMEFVPASQTVNASFYEQFLKRLLQHIRCVGLELHRTGKLMLLHDNAPAHCAIHVHQFLVQHGVPVLSHPPYPCDLVPADFFLCSRLKSDLKGFCYRRGNSAMCARDFGIDF
ncbi:hypothetical protein PR048_001203 [Dryococelus australis]|uniref:Transposase n=1 Tax=Dryococelus australis TaxID=614101 RepID=A0ABQ9IGQ1_9NEOP|nr:hypothetical protein PR048_001203 [Dryococelus australis]